jgi:hypothetical protein
MRGEPSFVFPETEHVQEKNPDCFQAWHRLTLNLSAVSERLGGYCQWVLDDVRQMSSRLFSH